MSRHNSTTTFAGFSVFQPALGTPLQWLPALGSLELDDMIHTLLPGPASIQDKRAHISMDFYEYSRHTGESFRFYAVYPASFATTATGSPASSSALQDSGYGSSFNASPVVSDISPWTPSAPVSTPASTASDSRTKSRSGSSHKRTSASSRQPLDFSNHPGMRILTKDGRDVTNSASRGCKSKEQRDHAHLMRIIKACDACRRKKIRCDPSHKKRTTTQAQPSRPESKHTKAAKVPAHESASQDASFPTPSSQDSVPSFDPDMFAGSSFDNFNETPDDFWQQFVHLDDQAVPSLEGYDGYDFSLHPTGYLTSSTGSQSASPSQSLLPATPLLQDSFGLSLPDPASQQPVLPYLNPGGSYGTNYQDFNLFSPGSDSLDEEPLSVKKHRHKEETDKPSVTAGLNLQQAPQDVSGLFLDLSTGLSRDQGDLPGSDFSDWCHVDIDRIYAETTSARVRHEAQDIPTAIVAHANRSVTGPPTLPPLSLSRGSSEGASVNQASVNGLEQVRSTQAGNPIFASAPATASSLLSSHAPQEAASAYTVVRTYSSHFANAPGEQLTVPPAALAHPGTPTAVLAVTGGLTLGAVPSSAVQNPGSALLRHSQLVTNPSVLAAGGTSGGMSRDLAVSSLLSAARWRDADVHTDVQGAAENHVSAAPLSSSLQSGGLPSRLGSTSLAGPDLRAPLVASSLSPPATTPQDVPGVQPGSQQLRIMEHSTTPQDAPGVDSGSQQLRILEHPEKIDLVSLCLVSCLLVILVSWAGVQWQREFVLAACLSTYWQSAATEKRHFGGRSGSVAARAASLLGRDLSPIRGCCA